MRAGVVDLVPAALLTCEMRVCVAANHNKQSGVMLLLTEPMPVPVPIYRHPDGHIEHKLNEAIRFFLDLDPTEIEASTLRAVETRIVTAFVAMAESLPNGCPRCPHAVTFREGIPACHFCNWEASWSTPLARS